MRCSLDELLAEGQDPNPFGSISLADLIRAYVLSESAVKDLDGSLEAAKSRRAALYKVAKDRLFDEMGTVALVVDGIAYRANSDGRGMDRIPVKGSEGGED